MASTNYIGLDVHKESIRSCSTSAGLISDLKAPRLHTARRDEEGFRLG